MGLLYQNGIAYNGKPYIFQTSKVTWSKRTGAGYFMAYEMLQMAGMPKGANVSYIKDAQERVLSQARRACGAGEDPFDLKPASSPRKKISPAAAFGRPDA